MCVYLCVSVVCLYVTQREEERWETDSAEGFAKSFRTPPLKTVLLQGVGDKDLDSSPTLKEILPCGRGPVTYGNVLARAGRRLMVTTEENTSYSQLWVKRRLWGNVFLLCASANLCVPAFHPW